MLPSCKEEGGIWKYTCSFLQKKYRKDKSETRETGEQEMRKEVKGRGVGMEKWGWGGNGTSLSISFTLNHSNVSFFKTKKSTTARVWWLPKVEYNFIRGESCSVMSDSLCPCGLYSPWNSPGQNTGVDCCSLLQGIFPIQELNAGLPYCKRILYQPSRQGSITLLHNSTTN